MELQEAITSYEEDILDMPWLSGCSGLVLAAEEGEILYSSVVAGAKDRTGSDVTPNSRFLIGSITKQFTATLVLKMVQQGTLELAAPITRYLPDYPASTGDLVTLHHLLSQTSGIPNYIDIPGVRLDDPQVYEPDEVLNLFSGLDLHFSSGEQFEYSNSNYVVLGLILERVTGEQFADLLQEYILDIAGMNDTGYDPALDMGTIVPGYVRDLNSVGPAPHANRSLAFAAGGMYSTAADLVRWERALTENRILPPAFTDLLFEKHADVGNGIGYGYGWGIGQTLLDGDPTPVYSHIGGVPGYTSLIMRIPDKEAVIIVLCNILPADVFELGGKIRWTLYA